MSIEVVSISCIDGVSCVLLFRLLVGEYVIISCGRIYTLFLLTVLRVPAAVLIYKLLLVLINFVNNTYNFVVSLSVKDELI